MFRTWSWQSWVHISYLPSASSQARRESSRTQGNLSFLLSLLWYSGRGLKAADLHHRVSPNPIPGDQLVIFTYIWKDIGAKDKAERKVASPSKDDSGAVQGICRRNSE